MGQPQILVLLLVLVYIGITENVLILTRGYLILVIQKLLYLLLSFVQL